MSVDAESDTVVWPSGAHQLHVPRKAVTETLRESRDRAGIAVAQRDEHVDIRVRRFVADRVLGQGRVLVDRDRAWPRFKATERGWRRRAAAAEVASPMSDGI